MNVPINVHLQSLNIWGVLDFLIRRVGLTEPEAAMNFPLFTPPSILRRDITAAQTGIDGKVRQTFKDFDTMRHLLCYVVLLFNSSQKRTCFAHTWPTGHQGQHQRGGRFLLERC